MKLKLKPIQMMVKIFIFLFSISPILSQEINSRSKIRFDIQQKYNENKYSELIPMLEFYTNSFPEEKIFFLYLAKSYLFNPNLKSPINLNNTFQNNKEYDMIKNNYTLSSNLFGIYIPILEDKDISQNWQEWYFYWAFSEMLLGQKQKAYELFLKSNKKNNPKPEAYYNAAILALEMGNISDAKRNFLLFRKLTNEKK
jgi:tetratricopeptide (TPR) repeat protein